jgi:hypothetical protein
MPHDTRWTTINASLVEHFRACQTQQAVPARVLSPDGLEWESAGAYVNADAPDDWLGFYTSLRNPSCIQLDFQRLLRFAGSIAAHVGGSGAPTLAQSEQVFVAAAYVIYQHGLFHHYCDRVRKMHARPHSDVVTEEALAVAFSWHRLHSKPELLQDFSASQNEDLVELMFGYRRPGYRDWRNFTERHHFLQSACEHMWGDATGKLTGNNFFLDPFLAVLFDDPALPPGSIEVFKKAGNGTLTALWTPVVTPPAPVSWDRGAQEAWLNEHVREPWSWNGDGTVDVRGDVTLLDITVPRLPVRFGSIHGSFDCAGVGLAFVEGLPRHVGGDLICSSNRFTSLEGIGEVVKHVGGRICFHNNPLVSHVIGLANITGGQRVSLDHSVLRRIFATHDCELNDNLFAVQADMIDEGLEPFAQL